jgi:hypothetical protein
MGRKAGTGTDMLKRIIALLFALADLAERAAGRSRPVRWLVLGILRHADTTARRFVARCPSNPAGAQCLQATLGRGHAPDDAFNLAASLRALARIVRIIAAHLCRLSFLRPGHAAAGYGNCGQSHLTVVQSYSAVSRLERCDTS